MKKLLLLLVLALPAIADTPAREIFPSDYKPSPCAADASVVCQSFPQNRMRSYAGDFRGFNLKQEWVDAHWDEMLALFTPICGKMGNCFAVKGNDWVYCLDLMRNTFVSTCDRFPAGSEDHRQCTWFATIYFVGLGGKTKLHESVQECVAQQPPSATLRKLEAWLDPHTFTADFDGQLTAYAYDAETHVPVRARVAIDAGTLKPIEGRVPTTGYPVKWRAGLKRVPNAQGHTDVVAPTAMFTFDGYEPLMIPIAMAIPTLTIQMTPSAAELRPGMNTITVTAHDSITDKPVEMRVMAGDRVLGNANKTLQFEWKRGEKRPEIWLTSLWNRYSDVVIVPAR